MKANIISEIIPAGTVKDFEKFMTKASRNLEGLQWTVGEPYERMFYHNVDGHAEKWLHKVVDVTITVPEQNNWKLLATVVDGVLFVTNMKEKLNLSNGHGENYRICDCCKHRQWKKSFIVENVVTGEELQVGAECAKKFGINMMNAVYKLTSELYASYVLSIGEGDDFPHWSAKFSDPYAVRSVETSIVVIAAKKYYDEHDGVWIKGYYTDGGYGRYVPSESASDIRASLGDFEADEHNAYYVELKNWLNNNFVACGDFEENIKSVGENFYLSAGNTAAAFFAIKKYEMWKREQANKDAGIYVPKRGDYIHIIGKIVNSSVKSGYFGDYTEYEILSSLDGNLYKRSGSVKSDENNNVDCFAFVEDVWNGNYRLGRVTLKAKKGVEIANAWKAA